MKSQLLTAGLVAIMATTQSCYYVPLTFREVNEDFYRAPLMNPRLFEKKLTEHKIKTVINLRDGYNKKESAIAERLGVDYHQIPLLEDDYESGETQRIEEVIDILKTCEKPVLVHCHAGVHRAGYVTAVWTIDIDKQPDKALDQLVYYDWPIPGETIYEKVIEKYLLETKKNSVSFEKWVSDFSFK